MQRKKTPKARSTVVSLRFSDDELAQIERPIRGLNGTLLMKRSDYLRALILGQQVRPEAEALDAYALLLLTQHEQQTRKILDLIMKTSASDEDVRKLLRTIVHMLSSSRAQIAGCSSTPTGDPSCASSG
ncbi:hypothetical protein J2T57_004460 [Natronocella acetinitrilica]|uniref:Mobilization protein n=2 Tax=Natronocella acetinitrilica TaxID=414046 RepID=A0AAE3G7N1_9GAMM|nr:hypothetical protein [Natronocella acetinitrilica]